MPMIEITDREYAEFKEAVAERDNLKRDNSKMKEAAENTAKALKDYRDNEKTLKEQISELETSVNDKEAELTTKTEELESIKENAEKWTSHVEAEKQARLDNIEEMKTKLGDKFDENAQNFIDGLPDEKVEAYLQSIMPKEDNGKPAPTTVDGEKGDSPGSDDPNAVDTALANGDFNAALSALSTKN